MRFGPWHPLDRAAELAPPTPGLLQVRGDALQALPRGKSAMLFYAASADGEPLAALVRQRADDLQRAAGLGGRWIRFAETPRPAAALARLLDGFQERFGALPPAQM